MTIVRTATYKDIYDLLEELDNQSLSLRAFATLLECTMREADTFFTSDDAMGATSF